MVNVDEIECNGKVILKKEVYIDFSEENLQPPYETYKYQEGEELWK